MFSVLGTDFGSNCQNCAILIPKWNGHNPSPGLLTRSPPPHNSPSMQGLHHEQMHSGQSQGLEQQPKSWRLRFRQRTQAQLAEAKSSAQPCSNNHSKKHG